MNCPAAPCSELRWNGVEMGVVQINQDRGLLVFEGTYET